jgi:hypothetical protein
MSRTIRPVHVSGMAEFTGCCGESVDKYLVAAQSHRRQLMFTHVFSRRAFATQTSKHKKRLNRREPLHVALLEARRLLSATDLSTAATVTAIRHGVAEVQPTRSAYAANADSVKVAFTASDPDNAGPAPTTHFTVTDTTTGTVVINDGTGSSFTLSQQGDYQVQYWSTDSDDSEPVDAHSILISVDRTSPSLTISSVSHDVLWPPNGKFVTVTVAGAASDSLSGVNAQALKFHVVDEYGRVEPSGNITNVAETGATAFGGFTHVDFTFQVQLQARRFGFDKDGRHYTIDVSAADMAGNTAFATAQVVVPHDMGRHHGFHGTGHGGVSTGTGATHHGHKSLSHIGHHGKHHMQGSGAGGTGTSDSGSGTVIGTLSGSDHNHGNGNGNHHGDGGNQGNGNGNGNGHGNGNGGGGNDSGGNDQGSGNGHGNGHGNGNGNDGGGNDQGNGNGHGNGNGNGHGKGNG